MAVIVVTASSLKLSAHRIGTHPVDAYKDYARNRPEMPQRASGWGSRTENSHGDLETIIIFQYLACAAIEARGFWRV
jgi:hypothetical protein